MTRLADSPPETGTSPWRPHRAAVVALASLTVTTLHLIASAFSGASPTEPFGLIHAMPVTYVVAIVVAVAALVLVLALPREHPRALAAITVSLTLAWHGTAIALEPVARFPTAWLHAGYTQYVMSNQEVLPSLGARFSWPGFFEMTALALAPFGEAVPEPVLRWAPLAFTLAYLPPLLVIARALGAQWRTAWIALAVFTCINWVGQDYYAPQSLGFLLGLVLLAIALTWFTGPSRLWAPRDGLFRRGGLFRPAVATPAALGVPARVLLVVALATIASAVAFSHQLTPFAIALQIAVIWLLRRGRALLVALLVGLLASIWLSWGAQDFWVPWFSDIFGNVGRPGDVLEAALVERTRGASPEHETVVIVRMVLTAAVWGLAGIGLLREWLRRRAVEPAAPFLAAAPFALLLAQSYGGEGLLRVFLFAAPFVAILVAKAVSPDGVFSRRSIAVFAVATLATAPVFLIARYGNESFEQVTAAEVELAECMYDTADPGSTLGAISPHLAWQFRDIADHAHVYGNAVVFDTEDADAFVDILGTGPGERYLIVTQPQLRFVERTFGAPEGWGAGLEAELNGDPRLTPVCENEAGVVYQAREVAP